LVQPVSPAK